MYNDAQFMAALLFSLILGIFIPVFIVAEITDIPTNSVQVFPSLHSPTST